MRALSELIVSMFRRMSERGERRDLERQIDTAKWKLRMSEIDVQRTVIDSEYRVSCAELEVKKAQATLEHLEARKEERKQAFIDSVRDINPGYTRIREASK